MIAWSSRATPLRGTSHHRSCLWTVVLVLGDGTSRSSSGWMEETSRCTASMSFLLLPIGVTVDYRLTPLGDGRTVLLSHTRYGDELLVVDAVEDAVVARTALGGVSPTAVEFLPQRNEVWIGQHDQLLRFDPARMAVTDAVRLRNDRSGSFIEALRSDTSESRCAVSYALRSRDPRNSWAAEPSGGRILLFDVESFRVVGSVEAPGWVDDLALMSNNRVCGRINFEMWLGQIAAAQHPLYPPRPPGERNWM